MMGEEEITLLKCHKKAHSMTDKVTEEIFIIRDINIKTQKFLSQKNDSQDWLVQRISAEFINPLYFRSMISNLDRIFHKH